MCGKIFKFMEFTFLDNPLVQGIFTHAPPHTKITHSPRSYFFDNLFPPTAEKGVGNYDLLYQNSVRKYEDDLEH